MQLLTSGPECLDLYADASFSDDLYLGAWAYTVPALSLASSGVERSNSVNMIELSAVVHGLIAAIGVDRTNRAIGLHTDSLYALDVLEYVSQRALLPREARYISILRLYEKACDITQGRILKPRWNSGDPHHRDCHQRANAELRRHCCTPGFARPKLLKRARNRRRALLKQMRNTEALMSRLESELLLREMEIAALMPCLETEMQWCGDRRETGGG